MRERHADLDEAIAKKIEELQPKLELHQHHQNLNKGRYRPRIRTGQRKINARERKLQEEADKVKAGLGVWRPELEPYLHPRPAATNDLDDVKDNDGGDAADEGVMIEH